LVKADRLDSNLKPCKGNVGNFRIFNLYLLNRAQNFRDSNKLSFSDTKITRTYARDSVSDAESHFFVILIFKPFQCFVSCYLQKKGIVSFNYQNKQRKKAKINILDIG
jgi:hypothetical protein